MENRIYPLITADALLGLRYIVGAMDKDPSYLDRPECTFSEDVKSFFRSLTQSATVTPTSANLFEGRDDIEVFDEQIQRALTELNDLTVQFTDVNDKLTVLKPRSSMLEKLISLKERNLNLKEISQFREILLAAIEELCSKDQTTEIMKRLEGVLEA